MPLHPARRGEAWWEVRGDMDLAWRLVTRVRRVAQKQAALRTLNIRSMVVTLETSQESGWLKVRADCQAMRGVVGSGRRDGSCVARGVGRAVQRQAALRTENI